MRIELYPNSNQFCLVDTTARGIINYKLYIQKMCLYIKKVEIADSINRLAKTLDQRGELDSKTLESLGSYDLVLDAAKQPVQAFQFVDYVREHSAENASWNASKLITTLDGNLQLFTEQLLENRLQSLKSKNINNAAAIIINRKHHVVALLRQ